mgnify:CR=1 FL=1
MNKYYKQVVTAALLMTSCIPAAVMADSGSDIGGGNLSADARLNLRVIIPRFLLFRVGSLGSVDTITFAPTDAEVGDGNPIAGTGGDVGGNGATVAVRSNGGPISISEANDGGAGGLGTGGAISLTEITVTSDNTALETPPLSDGGGNSINVTVSNGNVTNRTAIWSYTYDNTTTPADGSYDADITYTAANF